MGVGSGAGAARARAGTAAGRSRRSRCGGCGRSHVLLPVTALLRRADGVEVIGAALEAKTRGDGHRRIAAMLGRAESTVRGWLRRFAAVADQVRGVFTGLLVAVAGTVAMLLPAATGTAFGDAVASVIAVSLAVWKRFGAGSVVNDVSVWLLACAVTGGRLLGPPGTVKLINTSWLWEPPM